ncbi:uncharacterized protein LOC120079220 [Benincasa hispida]|uniref:uncharacterized protein LOC120079220 n=1 Tax=Benincasa hispida TaxID=102211 RepID=UPI0018FF9923|nr:uncharacterized protein LOC120079220 [Benincasa hispida]
MSSSTIALFKKEKLTSKNYATLKLNLSTILIIDDLRFILTEKCPQVPILNAALNVKDAYDHWTKANEKARVYILASLFDVLNKRHEAMLTACEIIKSLQGMFGQPSIQIQHEALKYVYNARMKEGQSVREHVHDLMVKFNVAKMNEAVIDKQS